MSGGDRGGFRLVAEGTAVPEISILMPTCEQERYVRAAIESVLAQRDVVAEILVSDDASTDQTWPRVDQALREVPTGPHRVLVRRGPVRLRRDHTVLLEEAATAPVVMAAHGDDVSEPDRGRRILDVLQSSGAVLVGSRFTPIDEHGRRTVAPVPPEGRTPTGSVLGAPEVVEPRKELIGGLVAWRPSALRGFERLDQRHAAASHDRILAFRAALAGGATVVDEPLVRRRFHAGAWSAGIVDRRSPETSAFWLGINRVAALRVMGVDLRRAVDLGLVDVPAAEHLGQLLDAASAEALESALTASHSLVVSGRLPLWVTERELALAAQGNLASTLARRARLQGPLARLVSLSRVARARVGWRGQERR